MKWFRFIALLVCICFIVQTNTSAKMIKRKEIEPTGQVIWDVPTQKKLIALTFDDGPSPIYTPQVLTILEHFGAHATFFQIGNRMERYPEIVEQVVESGHELGNHSMTHSYENKVGFQKFRDEITHADQIIQRYQPNHPKLFRPPGGYLDNALLQEARKQGYKVVLWSYHQELKDWSMPGAMVMANHVIRNARNGDIILLHDGGGDRHQTIQALGIFLPVLKKRGFEFVSVSELLSHKK
ncbi:polysaccharide deacetylase family protein [Ammoniphilus resinae]|uniref:Peptidoglycan/xylan/chitin deacetylase (PgdA/CDA1 family) n=1 Tax=Ammoniphilus resinae TaxID=861532 RepID=A0ABS4GP03_9BACL|nr:polysaccharide deacetylase family protein [Ammoniphilus resinae]MBP1932013.1 peptidoglycan/xylan/chitin deacetylase (PgdA/CDA1 family) [Ammoniphilus resinae]